MWRRKKFIVISVLAAVILLVVGVIGGVASAQTGDAPEKTGSRTLLARVAEILGIEQSELESAVTQAREEMRDEALDARLQRLVEAGRLTQEQADEYKAWIESRPDVPAGLDAGLRLGPCRDRGFQCFPRMGRAPITPLPAPSPTITPTPF
jgi:hypothetical protein